MTDMLDSTQILTAPPGWVARRIRIDEKTGSVDTDYLPVVGWAVGSKMDDRAPVVWNVATHQIGIPAELEAAADWAGYIDTYLFDADALDLPPDVEEAVARERLMQPDDFKAWEHQRALSRQRLIGGQTAHDQ
jgi:hypothetical protein